MDRDSGEETVSLTDRAEQRIASLLESQGLDPDSAGLHVAVERGGCAGLTYRLDLRPSPADGDHLIDGDSVRIFVDAAAVEYVDGTSIDVTESAHGTGFRIENPNADQQCGCGISFR